MAPHHGETKHEKGEQGNCRQHQWPFTSAIEKYLGYLQIQAHFHKISLCFHFSMSFYSAAFGGSLCSVCHELLDGQHTIDSIELFNLSVSPETAVSLPSLQDCCMKQTVLSLYIEDAVNHNLIQESCIVD